MKTPDRENLPTEDPIPNKAEACKALVTLRDIATEQPGTDRAYYAAMIACNSLPEWIVRNQVGNTASLFACTYRLDPRFKIWIRMGFADDSANLPPDVEARVDKNRFAELFQKAALNWIRYLENMMPVLPAEAEAKAMAAGEVQCGCLSVFDGFRRVLCHKKPYDLTDATQARELLRFLCAKKAHSESTAQKKADILATLKKAGGTVANDWRPAHVFRGKHTALYRDAIGRNPTKGLYWINP